MTELSIPSTDQKNKLHVEVWEPEGEIRAILQISHGMVEYVERFQNFALWLNQYGILVIGNDHLGHGKTAAGDADLGYIGAGKSGAILSGTGYTPGSVLGAAGLIAGWLRLTHGERYRSAFLKQLSFKGYLDRIQNPRTANDWLTCDPAIVDRYNADRFCTYTFTVNGYQTLFDVIRYIQDPRHVGRIPKDIPILFISGEEDPVGSYGQGVKKVFESYRAAGIKDVDIHLYPGKRHELTNEIGKEEVYEDIRNWIGRHLTGKGPV